MRARHLVPSLIAVVALTAASCGDAQDDAAGSGDPTSTSTSDNAGTDERDPAGDAEQDDGDDAMDQPDDDGTDDAAADDPADEPEQPDPDNSDDSDTAATPPALDFTATTVTGESFEGASLAGKPTVLWFWAPWCPVCASQASSVAELAEAHDGELNVIGVAGLDEQSAMEEFIANNDVDGITHLSDEEGAVWKRFEVTEQSSFVLLDGDGEQQYRQGYRESDELTEHVDELLR